MNTTAIDAEGGRYPLEIRVSKDRATLTVLWDDRRSDAISAPSLRDACQSAGAKSLRLKGLDVPARGDLTVTNVAPLGHYAVNITFSDGHDRGIYPWSLLRELGRARQPAEADAIP
ncbi:gamma-butyrobetaine hydroxylase-like domain-containing protein [Lutibaculum baratangense]|uniref:Gamma-butyrobetaine hydroxylase-like N-terminal domain-containing protein n=1 Tax=Lutibaculum baratangense AMV1 TaxID=631454 RepID=V4R666_9HYPH|nr:gamma-butyrobetaine hydroxylase-like domain-containing protein [Lutibaculum baratangense]ESR27417.1 hypothetical protein N177_0111 [Lutibaculum baratangense AMV1]